RALLTKELHTLKRDSEILLRLTNLRAACRNFLDTLQQHGITGRRGSPRHVLRLRFLFCDWGAAWDFRLSASPARAPVNLVFSIRWRTTYDSLKSASCCDLCCDSGTFRADFR